MKKLGIIGIGNIGSALASGMLKKNVLKADTITVADFDNERAEAFAAETGVSVSPTNADLAAESEVIIIAVKPDIVPSVIAEIKEKLSKTQVLVSVALGVSLESLGKMSGNRAKLVRCLPNTPVLVNEGMTCISVGPDINEADTDLIKKYFGAIGEVEFMTEKLLGRITALTSSSPAYVFIFIEAMADAAVLCGIPRDMSYRLAAQSVLGSAKMLRDTGRHPAELKDMVCSPGGATIEAVRSLEKSGFRNSVIEAMIESEKKVDIIAKQSSGS